MEKKGKVEQKHEKGRKTDCCHHAGSSNDGVTDTGGMHIFLQNEIVYAAETNEASAPTVTRTELYKNENAKTTETIDFSGLQEEDWNGAGKITFAYDESINGSSGNVNEEY